MQSVFVIITKLIASENYFCKEFFCNNFGRGGSGPHTAESSIAVEEAVDYRSPYRILVECLLSGGLRHCTSITAELSLISGLG